MSKPAKIIVYVFIFALILFLIALPKLDLQKDNLPATADASSRKLPVNALVVTNKNLENTIRVTGTIIANESVDLKSEISGKVSKIYFREGQRVKKGDLLLKINDDDLRANLEKLKYTKKLYEDSEYRQRKLLEREAISQEEYDQALNLLNTTSAEIKLQEVQISKSEIRAPFDGIIGLRSISEGSYITPSSQIANLYNIEPVKIEFSVAEKYSGMINVGDKVRFSTESAPEVFTGNVYAIEPQIDQSTRTLKIRAIAPNREHKLLPGHFARIELVLESMPDAIMVPTESLIPELSGHKLYVARKGKAEAVNVKTGIRTDREVQILEGIVRSDTVLTSGLLQLRPGMEVSLNILK